MNKDRTCMYPTRGACLIKSMAVPKWKCCPPLWNWDKLRYGKVRQYSVPASKHASISWSSVTFQALRRCSRSTQSNSLFWKFIPIMTLGISNKRRAGGPNTASTTFSCKDDTVICTTVQSYVQLYVQLYAWAMLKEKFEESASTCVK